MSIIEQALEKARRTARREPDAPPIAPPRPWQDVPAGGNTPAADGALLPREPIIRTAPVGEEYRLFKERLLAIQKADHSKNMFLITSPMRNEGKTHVACNLARSLAQELDHTVLLIDADMRSPSCHRMLGIPRPEGLSDCLTRGKKFWEVLIHTGVGRLSFLSSGLPAPNTAELFASKLMRDLLMEIKQRYDDRIILIDTTPILPFAETRSLSRLVDGVILVVRENVTVKSHLEATMRLLKDSNFIGAVYNDAQNQGADKDIFNLRYSY